MKIIKGRKRGARISTKLNLPKNYHWKVLGAFVQDLKGYLEPEDVLCLQKIIRDRDFQSYLQLDSKWGLPCMNSADRTEFSLWKARYAIASLFKKYLPNPDSSLDALALDKLLEAEEGCREYNEELSLYFKNGDTKFTRHVLYYMRSFLKQLLGDEVPVKAIIQKAKHGPGANLDTQNGEVHAYAKYMNYPYSCTKEAVSYACYMIQSDQRWFRALKNEYRRLKSLDSLAPIDMTDFWDTFIKTVDHNRITFVPKTAKISRSIAIEPALNLMLQLGTGEIISRKLKRWGIDLNSQEFNRLLSRIGSKYGIFATIDLSSASDLISLALCHMILPPEWYTFLCKLRAPNGVFSQGERTGTIQYQKISSMGNGYTFALESAIFAAAVYAAHKVKNQHLRFSANAIVFGDDIIVRGDMYETVKDVLELCGFRLNISKSFNFGPVRESCGMDWFQGLPIRPILLKAPPTDLQNLFVDHNVIKRYLSVNWGIEDSFCCKTILNWVPPMHNSIKGPLSDHIFDSWIHTSEAPSYSNGFPFTRVIRSRKKTIFSKTAEYGFWDFRVLAHNLKSPSQNRFYVEERIKTESGSRFVVNSKGFTTKRKPAVWSQWPASYNSSLPSLS